MKSPEFDRLADRHRVRGKTRAACRLVLVEGKSGYAAADSTDVAESTVSRALKRLARPLCKTCGQPITDGDLPRRR